MAEILIKAQVAAGADPANPMTYLSGDPVVVAPDGHPWGLMETVPDFWKLRVTDKTVAEINAFLISILDAGGNPTKRRKYKVNIDGMEVTRKNLMLSGGIPSFTWVELRKQILDKATGLSV